MNAQRTLTVDDVRGIAAGLPAKYEKQQQADQRELQRVYEYHALTAEAALCGGNTNTVMPEELEEATQVSQRRLHTAKRTAAEAAYHGTLEQDLRAEREATMAALSGVARWREKIAIVQGLMASHGAPIPPALIHDAKVCGHLEEALARLEISARTARPAPPRPSAMSPKAILDRVLARV